MADQAEFETPKVLHDAPLRDSDEAYFHFDDFARTLARLIASRETRTPLTIGVSGPWGAGKTTLLRRICKQLDATLALTDLTRPPQLDFATQREIAEGQFRVCRTVWFDAWKYADEDELLVALVRVILNTMAEGGLGDKAWSKLLDPAHPRYDVLATFLSMFKVQFGGIQVGVELNKHKTETPFAQHTAFFDFFDVAFETLLARWVHGAGDVDQMDEQRGVMVVFVDDLDRCLPKKTVQVLEAIKLFLDKPGCVFVLGADANVIRQAVASHYKDAGVTGESAGDYLEKIIQLRFELPPILTGDMGKYVEATQEIVDDEVRRNWQTIVVGAEINPRKVKTFVNDLSLQWAMLKNSGQAQGVDRDDFTRWQVLMRAAPQNFIQRVRDLDDVDLRHKFIADALRWAGGDESLAGTFQEYAGSLRLRRVLRVVQFSHQFTADVLDAFVHLTAPQLSVELRSEEYLEVLERMGLRPVTKQVFGGMEFVRVPKGKFIMGSKDDHPIAYGKEKTQHTVEIPYDYWIARYPVTNDRFAEFVKATQYVTQAEKEGGHSGMTFVKGFDWQHPHGPESNLKDKGDHPVVQVSWHDAVEYCKWLGAKLRGAIGTLVVRLPTEAEWEKAARGEYGNEWPWGNKFDPTRCRTSESSSELTIPVGTYSPQGDSPYGVADMIGNVWEWCHSLSRPYPYKTDDGREDESGSDLRVVRGGVQDCYYRHGRCACRDDFPPDFRAFHFGFRVVVAPQLS